MPSAIRRIGWLRQIVDRNGHAAVHVTTHGLLKSVAALLQRLASHLHGDTERRIWRQRMLGGRIDGRTAYAARFRRLPSGSHAARRDRVC
jgi:hypothetical protein